MSKYNPPSDEAKDTVYSGYAHLIPDEQVTPEKCPKCGKKMDKCPNGHWLCFECGFQSEGCDWPKIKGTDKKPKRKNR